MIHLDEILEEIGEELQRAEDKFPPFNSAHEGYAVIKEELDELWDEVKNNKDPEAYDRMREEAIQIAAMGARFVYFLDNRDDGPHPRKVA